MEKTYLQANMDFDALDEKLRKFVACRNELAILAHELGMTVQRDLLTMTLEKAPTCSGNCKQGEND